MPPKFKFTKDEIIAAALDLTRQSGPDALTARALAAKLGCSVKPIFSLFQNMEEVQGEVLKAAYELYDERLHKEIASGEYPPYKASGMSYIRFAKEQRELFKLLFMRTRTNEAEFRAKAETEELVKLVSQSTGMNGHDAYLFHLEMWIYVHGIATMIATSYLEWDWDFISRTLTDVFMGLKNRYQSKINPEIQ